MSTPESKLTLAIQPTRPLFFYTLTATLPLIVISAVLLFTSIEGTSLVTLSLLGALTGIVGFGRLVYETTLDIAGYPDYTLPIWSVFYLIIYLISSFAFLFFAMHIGSPGRFFGGFGTNNKVAFLDALYVSLCDYIGQAPDPSFQLKTQGARFLAIGQGVLSMFLNVVIITKFVSAF
jgi:hypothetical protein